MTRFRSVSPDGRPGTYGTARAAIREAARAVTGKDDLDEAQVSAVWQGLKDKGWRIESERAWE